MIRPVSLLFLATASLAFAPTSQAQCVADRFHGTATQAGDFLGWAIDQSGTQVALGAPLDDQVAGPNDGSVTIFEQLPNGLVQWDKVNSPDPHPQDRFGYDVAFDGNTLAASAFAGDGAVADSGAVYLFTRTGTTGNFSHSTTLTLPGGSAGDIFGRSIALSTDLGVQRLVVGCPGEDAEGLNTGRFFIYESASGGPWSLVHTGQMLNPLIQDHCNFGRTMDSFGPWVIVGAPLWNEGSTADAGIVSIYSTTSSGYLLNHIISSPNPATAGRFGHALSVTSTRLVVGAPGETLAGQPSGTGVAHVYLYNAGTGSWALEDSVTGSDSQSGDQFGSSVSLETSRLVAGAPTKSGGGGAYALSRVGTSWGPTTMFTPEPQGGAMGFAVSLRYPFAYVSDHQYDNGSTERGGSAYFGRYTGTDCDSNGQLDMCQSFADPALDLDDNGELDECQCVFTTHCTSNPNSTGATALMLAVGSLSVSDNDFTLAAGPLPNNFGYFYFGLNPNNSAFGNGVRCVGGQVFRLTQQLAVNQSMIKTLDLTAPPHPTAQFTGFSTWYFQAWFRDPGAGGSFYNLSDGLQVTFCP